MGGVLKKKTFLIFLIFAIISLGGSILFWPKAQAVITAGFPVTGGTNTILGVNFTTQISRLNGSGNRVGSGTWPIGNPFDESKYLEFSFSPNLPLSANIIQVLFKNTYGRNGALDMTKGVKYEIWSGGSFLGSIGSPLPSGEDNYEDVVDISSFVSSVEEINNLKVRFLVSGVVNASGITSNTETLHRLINLTVSYDSPESTSTPTPSVSETPTPSESPTPTPSESATPTPTSTPTPTPTPTPASGDVSAISQTATSILQSSAIADGNFSHGWKWTFDLTVPAAEPNLALKFDDWTSETASISAAGNMHIYSPQSLNAPTPETALLITDANVYSDNLLLAGDSDASRPGRQIQIVIEAKIPPGTIGGSYHTTYGFISSQ